MKTFTSAFLLICLLSNSMITYGQSKEEALSAESILWFGLDFSEARFVGKHDFKSSYELKEKFIPAWNQLMLSEAEKFNISEYFHVPSVNNDFGDVYARNEAINEDEIILGIDGIRHSMEEEDIQRIVSDYVTEYEGYGLVFIVESFNKVTVNATIWVTYFHIPSKTVVFTKRMNAEPGGFGLRNYWAGAIYKIMEDSEDRLGSWKRE